MCIFHWACHVAPLSLLRLSKIPTILDLSILGNPCYQLAQTNIGALLSFLLLYLFPFSSSIRGCPKYWAVGSMNPPINLLHDHFLLPRRNGHGWDFYFIGKSSVYGIPLSLRLIGTYNCLACLGNTSCATIYPKARSYGCTTSTRSWLLEPHLSCQDHGGLNHRYPWVGITCSNPPTLLTQKITRFALHDLHHRGIHVISLIWPPCPCKGSKNTKTT